MKIHVKNGDMVCVISGKDAGKKGKILSVDRETGRVIVEGVNMIKKHMKPTQGQPNGGISKRKAQSPALMYYYIALSARLQFVPLIRY